MKQAQAVVTLALMLVSLGAGSVRGDGECGRGYREFTEAERATMATVLEAAKKALPAPPQGWATVGDDSISVPTGLCRDFEDAPWNYQFSRTYQNTEGHEARNEKMGAVAADLKADMAKKQPRLDALQARMSQLGQELAAAAAKSDYARAEEISKEVEKAGAEYTALVEQGDTIQKANAAVAEAYRDIQMTATVAVNPKRENPAEGSKPVTAPAGTHAAFRWLDSDEGSHQAHALILIGPWKATGDGTWESQQRADAGLVAAQAMSVRLHADEARLAAMLAATDFNALRAALAP
jgi:hypothetical protein